MKVLVRMRYSQALRLVPGSNCPNERKARRKVSWTRSSASAALRVSRYAAEYIPGSRGIASLSNRASRSSGPGSGLLTASLIGGHASDQHIRRDRESDRWRRRSRLRWEDVRVEIRPVGRLDHDLRG